MLELGSLACERISGWARAGWVGCVPDLGWIDPSLGWCDAGNCFLAGNDRVLHGNYWLSRGTCGHNGARQHTAGLLGLVNNGLQGIGSGRRWGAAIQCAEHGTTRSGRNRFAGGLACNALHGVDVEAFVLQRDVGCVALEAALRAFDGRFLGHTHASTASDAASCLLANLAASHTAGSGFNTGCAGHEAQQAVDGDVASVGAVVGLCARGDLGSLVWRVLASGNQLVAHGVIDAALGCTHALRSARGALQNEASGLGLAKARDHRHQQRRSAGAQGVQRGLDRSLEEATDVGDNLVPGAARCLGVFDLEGALLALILAVLGLAVGQRLGGVAQGL